MNEYKELTGRLRDAAEDPNAYGTDQLLREAADALERLSSPESLTRYTLRAALYDEEEGKSVPGLAYHPQGEWVIYEDVIALFTIKGK